MSWLVEHTDPKSYLPSEDVISVGAPRSLLRGQSGCALVARLPRLQRERIVRSMPRARTCGSSLSPAIAPCCGRNFRG